MPSLGKWGGGQGPAWNHYCNNIESSEPYKRMPIIVAASVIGCKVWKGVFVGEPKNDGDLSHLNLGKGEEIPANTGFLLSPDCIHESMIFDKDTIRTFLRIALPTNFNFWGI